MAGHRPADWHVLDLDKDPTPGDPDRIRTLAKTLHDFADDVSDALRLVNGMAGEDTLLEWAGKSAEVFKEEFGGVPKNLKKLEKSYALCGDALADFWPKLERAQALADKALAKAREAQADLTSANSRLTSADSWVTRANKEADKYKDDPTGSKSSADKPDEAKVRAATRDAQHAQSAQTKAQSDVDSAQDALDAAKKMAADARKMREDAARDAKSKIDEASDAGIQNRSWWEEVGDWFTDNWDNIVAVCKIVVAVLGVVAMIIGGPILGAIVLIAALVVLADTLYKYSKGQASLWDVGLAALDCIPGMKGLTTLGGLAKGMKGLGSLGLKGMASAVRGLGARGLNSLRGGMSDLIAKSKALAGRCPGGDPIDLVSGEMLMVGTDVTLPGILPLEVKRTHLSTYKYGRWFGPSWTSTLDERLEIDDEGIAFASDDGMLLAYPIPSAGVPEAPLEGPRWPLEWDGTPGGRMTITDPQTGTTRVFEPRGEPGRDGGLVLPISARIDRNGHRIDFEYASTGEPTALRHSGGYHVAIGTENGRVTSLRLVGSADSTMLVHYEYDAGDLTRVYNSSGLPFRYDYDDQGRIVRWEDRCGSWYEFEYDEADRCVRGTGADGFLDCRLSYDSDARSTVYTDSFGHSTVHEHNELLQRTAVTDPYGNVKRYEWDRWDRLLAHRDPLGQVTRYDYDADGNLTAITSPDGTTARAEFNHQRLPIATWGGDGARWSYTYDSRGNRTSITTPLEETTTFVFDQRGALTEITDPAGATTRTESDAFGLPIQAVDPLGGTVRHVRGDFGRISEIRDGLGNVTRLAWTIEGKPMSRTLPDGSVETWEWDAEGRLVRHTDASGATTRFGYTHFDLPAWRSDAQGVQRHFRYDTELRLVGVTNEQGLTWSYRFGATGLLESETDFNGRTLSYGYDPAGRLVRRTNGTGQTTYYERDAAGRVVAKRSGETLTTFSYTVSGQVRRAQCGEIVVEAERDGLGRILRETANGRTITHAYDRLGRRTLRRTPSGALSRWAYSDRNLPSKLWSGGQEISFDHDRSGQEVARTFGAALRMERQWDTQRRLTSQVLHVPGQDGTAAARQVVSGRTYVYGVGDRLAEIDDFSRGRRRLGLDHRGRVLAIDGDSWRERYAYDASGNPTASAHEDGEGGQEQPHDYTGNRVRRAGRRTYTYDDQGRVSHIVLRTLSGGRRTWSFSWDADDRLTDVIVPGGRRWAYGYDPFGRRIEKQCFGDDGQLIERTSFTWDGQRLAEQTRWSALGEHTITWDYEPGTHRPMAQTERSRLLDAPQGEIDERFFAIVTDVVGTPVELVGLDGAVRWRGSTTLWGSELGSAEKGHPGCPLRFPGQYADEETGLHYNFHRYYDPYSVRYLSPDPLGLQAGPDQYAYVPNPYVWADPLGLQRCPTFVGIQWLTDKLLQRVSFRYQRFVTHTDYEQVWRLGDGREVHVDGGPTADGFIVEAKWTGGDHPGEWAASQYNPAHRHYDEDRITSQAEKLLALNEGLGGNGVRYATSFPEGAEHLKDLFSSKFPDEFADGRLNVFHVPGNGMD